MPPHSFHSYSFRFGLMYGCEKLIGSVSWFVLKLTICFICSVYPSPWSKNKKKISQRRRILRNRNQSIQTRKKNDESIQASSTHVQLLVSCWKSLKTPPLSQPYWRADIWINDLIFHNFNELFWISCDVDQSRKLTNKTKDSRVASLCEIMSICYKNMRTLILSPYYDLRKSFNIKMNFLNYSYSLMFWPHYMLICYWCIIRAKIQEFLCT